MRILRLNDGSEYTLDSCAALEGDLWITVRGIGSVLEAATLFSDTEKTCHMTDTYDTGGAPSDDYDGYTDLFFIRKDTKSVTLCMKYKAPVQ